MTNSEDLKHNRITLPIKNAFDEMSIQLFQTNDPFDAVEIVVYSEPDYETHLNDPDNVNDVIGTQTVVVKSVKELIGVLKEIKVGDYRRFNTILD